MPFALAVVNEVDQNGQPGGVLGSSVPITVSPGPDFVMYMLAKNPDNPECARVPGGPPRSPTDTAQAKASLRSLMMIWEA